MQVLQGTLPHTFHLKPSSPPVSSSLDPLITFRSVRTEPKPVSFPFSINDSQDKTSRPPEPQNKQQAQSNTIPKNNETEKGLENQVQRANGSKTEDPWSQSG